MTEPTLSFQISDRVARALADRLPDSESVRAELVETPRRQHGRDGEAALFTDVPFTRANQLRAMLMDMALDIRAGRYRVQGVTASDAERCADQARSAMFVSNALRGLRGERGIDDYVGLRWKQAPGWKRTRTIS
ncbi:hypothetical protein OG763_09790 [Streptomyces sp. NBC_01230]|uniref:hypothetical protein n=1 Tax=Streptomyces sp. NBC_01230 TaxID=2903784 RepID=UPI002E0F1721|nr:hypothetical protein OG763_09790 [Streptomyces sp. NBC_01230]